MKNLVLILVLCILASCQTLAGALGGGVGGGIGAALGGPHAAAIGAVGGVIAMESLVGGATPTDKVAAATGQPQGQVASAAREAGSLLHTVGWWYLILFVLLPLLTKKGRTWIKKFTSIHNSVSKQDIDDLVENTVSKKDVDDHAERLHKLEGFLSSIKPKNKS